MRPIIVRFAGRLWVSSRQGKSDGESEHDAVSSHGGPDAGAGGYSSTGSGSCQSQQYLPDPGTNEDAHDERSPGRDVDHGSNREDAVPRTDALLAHHDGTIHHDLPLLGYLYLLELLTRPDLLRQVLFSSARV
jgi:hypothetical protein